jgi:hypothetical protein
MQRKLHAIVPARLRAGLPTSTPSLRWFDLASAILFPHYSLSAPGGSGAARVARAHTAPADP